MCVWLVLALVTRLSAQEVAHTVQGKMEGVLEDGYTSYLGIPYASVLQPSGRFKCGGLPPHWSETRPSSSVLWCPSAASADCLALDVHVPSGRPDGAGWPVLVWLRSGGDLHPARLVLKGLILVFVTYRNGPLGFLCLGNEQIPGNTGAKDVVLALRWVRDNIVAFRGSPSNVVVAGQGFGAAVVEALILSTMAQGLFHGAIMQSGSITSPSAYNYDALERAKEYISLFSDNEDFDVAVSAMFNSNLNNLKKYAERINYPYYPFGMCLEKPFKKEERLLSEEPIKLLKSKTINKTPLIIGYNTNEGYIFENNLRKANVLNRISRDPTILLPDEYEFLNKEEMHRVVRQIKEVYFDHNQTMEALLGFYRDAYFMSHVYRSARLHASAQDHPVYLYQFAHAGDLGVSGGLRKNGPAHGDELVYLFPEGGQRLAGDDGTVQDKLIDMWSDFVKHLNPAHSLAVEWPRLDPREPRLLHVAPELETRPFPHSRAVQLWDQLYNNYYISRQNATGY